jgi:hypothetical protein
MVDDYEELRSSLMSELDYARETISQLLRSGDQLLTIVGTLAAAAFFAGHAYENAALRVTIPFILLIPAAFVLRLNALIQHLGGYRKGVEERLNALLKEDVFLWESDIVPVFKKSHSSMLNIAVFGGVWLVSCIFACGNFSRTHLSNFATALLVFGYIGSAAAMTTSFIVGFRLFGRAYKTYRMRVLKDSVARRELSRDAPDS